MAFSEIVNGGGFYQKSMNFHYHISVNYFKFIFFNAKLYLYCNCEHKLQDETNNFHIPYKFNTN
jgi:hypothetical protein